MDIRQLYQELIIDHSRRPRNCCALACASCQAQGFNPLCGDKLTVFVKLENNRIKEAAFQGSGCAICIASASLMTEHLKDKTLEEAEEIFQAFHQLVIGKPAGADSPSLGKLMVLGGVSEFPSRVKCATLAWHTLHAALQKDHEPVTTE